MDQEPRQGRQIGESVPQSHTRLLFHIVFATKERMPLLHGPWLDRMHAYLGGIVQNIRGTPIRIGGVEDHVHVFLELPPTLSVSEAVMKLKANSSRWLNEQPDYRGKFAWQEGYSAFSVSANRFDETVQYIANQAAHHSQRTFAQELADFARATGIAAGQEELS